MKILSKNSKLQGKNITTLTLFQVIKIYNIL